MVSWACYMGTLSVLTVWEIVDLLSLNNTCLLKKKSLETSSKMRGFCQGWKPVVLCFVLLYFLNWIPSDLLTRGCQHNFEATSKHNQEEWNYDVSVNSMDVIFKSHSFL